MDVKASSPDRNDQASETDLLPSGTVTFLFTDIEGSTRLLEQLREVYSMVLAEQRDLLRAAFQNWQGHEIDTQGDAFFVAFGRATDAIACVIEAQKELASHAWPQGVSVRVRMGLHTGEPMVARTGYVGMDVHRAARVAGAGHGGQVLLSQTTRDLIYQDLPTGSSLRSLGEHKLKDIRFPQHIFQLDIEGLPCDFPPLKTLSLAEEPPTPGAPPFKGLQYFDEADTGLFFGRSQVTARLVEAAGEQRLLAVIGASGSGKSSVLRAGLVPALKRIQPGCWETFILTPTAQPLESLAIHLTRATESMTACATLLDDLRREPRSLHLYAQKHGGEKQWLVVVDQFEELFTLCREEPQRQAFIANLLQAAEAPDGRVNVLVALRADFYEHLAEHPGLRDAVAKHQEYLGAMSAGELRQAIEEPAKLGGWEFAPGLVELMLHEVGAEGDRQPEPGALPLLSHALLETWNHRRGTLMNLKSYGEAGGVNRAIARTAERLYSQELTPAQQEIARNIFLRLTELGEGTQDTRRRATLHELFPPAPYGDPKDVEEVLVKLADARLIITGEGTAEVAHEALIREWPTLREWLAQNREGLLVQRRLTEAAQEWQLLERDPSALYRGVRLAQAVEWVEANPRQVNAQEQAFLDASRAEAQREEAEREAQRQRELEAARQLAETEKRRAEEQTRSAQRLRRRAVYLAFALLAAVAMVILAVVFARRASDNAEQAGKNLALAEIASTQAVAQGATAQAAGEVAMAEANTRATAEAEAVAQSRVAESQKQLAQAREWVAASISNLSVDPERSMLLAMQAIKTVDLPEAEQALHTAILASRLRDSMAGHTAIAYGVAFHPDGKRFATASEDGTVKIWPLDGEHLRINRVPLLILENPLDFRPSAETSGHNLEYSPDGSLLAAISGKNSARVWDAATGKLLFTLGGHLDMVTSLAFSPDSKLIVTGTYHPMARVWDASTGELLQTLEHDHIAISDVVFRPDGKQLLTADENQIVKVWERTVQGKAPFSFAYSFEVQTYPMRLVFSPDQKQLAIMGVEIGVYNYEAVSRTKPPQLIRSLYGHTDGCQGLAYNKDGSILYSASVDGRIKAWDIATGQEIFTLLGNAGYVGAMAISPDTTQLLSAYAEAIKLWDISDTGNREWMTIKEGDWYGGLKMMSQDGKTLIISQDYQSGIQVWELEENGAKEIRTIPFKQIDPADIHWYTEFPMTTGQNLQGLAVYYSTTNSIEWIDIETGAVQKTMSVDPIVPFIYGWDRSPDGSLLAFGLEDGSTLVWDLEKGVKKFTLTMGANDNVVRGPQFSPDGSMLATPGTDGFVRLWDTRTGKFLKELAGSGSWRAAFSPDGKRLLVPDGKLAVLYDLQTGQPALTLAGLTSTANQAGISPDGRYLAVSSYDKMTTVFDAGTGKQLLSVPGSTFSFTPDSKRLITTEGGGSMSLLAKTHGFYLEIDDLLREARSRLTRTWTLDECQKFLHMDACPPTP